MGGCIHELEGAVVHLDPAVHASLLAHWSVLDLLQALCYFELRSKSHVQQNLCPDLPGWYGSEDWLV